MSVERGERPAIFLVEDDDDTRTLLKENLVREGYRVTVAIDADDAIERVGESRIDAELILISLDKSPDDALSFARHLREDANWDIQTPIIVMSSVYPEELVGKDVAINQTDYVVYLDHPDQLPNLVARLLPQRANQ